MAPQISSYAFVQMDGPPLSPAERVQIIERPGVSGSGVRLLGSYGEPYALQTATALTATSGAAAALASYRALIGTEVTVVDNHSRSFANTLVLSVREIRLHEVKTAAGTLATPTLAAALLWCEWQLLSNDV